jgi:hypothetical protein
MVVCVRTTLNLDDALMSAAKREAAERGVTLTHVVEEALRARLTEQRDAEPYRLDFPVVRGWGPPRVDLDDRDALYEAMEESDRGG